MASAGIITLTDTLSDHDLGGIEELFGDTWAYTDINSSDFNVGLAAALASGAGTEVFVDSVTVTVYTITAGVEKAWTLYVRNEEQLSL